MTLTSYAQNFEDVLLWRALRDVENGRYLDIGAQDPIQESVSRMFYEHGWRGIHVEPTPTYAAALRAHRPEEIVIEAAVATSAGLITIHEIAGTGLSTGIGAIAREHASTGWATTEIIVPTIPLHSLFSKFGDHPIHWLKIDVEGMEADVLQSWGDHPVRPWIVLVEATRPSSQIESHHDWIGELLRRSYEEVWFDGLNRWFISADQISRRSFFTTPPNIFDGFGVTGRHFSALMLNGQWERELQQRDGDMIEQAAVLLDVKGQLAHTRDECDRLAVARVSAEAEAAEQSRLARNAEARAEAAASEAAASQAATSSALKMAAENAAEHAEALNSLWRERTREERSLRDELDGLRVMLAEARLEGDRLGTNLELALQGLTQADQLIRRTLAAESKIWHRLGRALRMRGNHAARDALVSWLATRSSSQQPAPEEKMQSGEMSEGRNPYLRANSLAELLNWDDLDFVRCAYVTLLGRQPDALGEAFYVKQLRQGKSKMQMLWQLRRSPEGQVHDPGIAGLDRALKKARWRRFPVAGGIVRPFLSHPANDRSVRPPESVTTGQALTERDAEAAPEGRLVDSAADLLAFHDEEFVRHAYIYVLGRPADLSGLKHFLQRVRSGDDRRQILAALRQSDEGQARPSQLPGLDELIRPFSRSRAMLFRKKEDSDRYLRAMINELYRREVRHDERVSRLETSVGQRIDLVEASLQRIVARDARWPSPDVAGRNAKLAELKAESRARLLAAPEPRTLRSRVIYYFVDHTINCPVNTGMQRVVRQLGRCLIEEGELIRFVKWNAEAKAFALIGKAELEHLADWSGPAVAEAERQLYTDNGGALPELGPDQDLWLLVPEVTHVTYQEQAPTLDVIMAAKELGAKIGFIYYDAIPLRLPEYQDGAEAHDRYMQSLLLADILIPISERSGREVRDYFVGYQGATVLPQIVPLHLPGESMLAPRVTQVPQRLAGKIILAVGSIEPRKNQLRLIDAFEQFARTDEGKDWQLVLAGHLRADVAAEVNAAIERNGRISYVPHPTDAALDELYRSAAFTVFPSVEEGFGLPILESLWYGVPCICANFGAMAEVAKGGGCLMVDTRRVSAIHSAIVRLASGTRQLADLAAEAVSRRLGTWTDYAESVRSVLTAASDTTRHLHIVYFWIDDTCRNPHNSGIQRVVRQLAGALLAQGYNLVPVKWEGGKLSPATAADLAHLEKWNGPKSEDWGSWLPPEESPQGSWFIVPEIVHGSLADVHLAAASAGLRCAAIFYDAIPHKMKDVFGPVFSRNHEEYMFELAKFDKVFPISEHSLSDIKAFLRGSKIRTNSFDHRFDALTTLGPFVHEPRNQSIKQNDGPVRILSVISIEPRKNPLTLIDAFARAAAKSERELHLKIIGRKIKTFDALAGQVEALTKSIPNFTWLQDVDDEQLARCYAQADFTVFPSLEEGYGLPIVESLWHSTLR